MKNIPRLVATALVISLLSIVTLLRAQDKASDKARQEHDECVNQIKQIGLAFRIWAGDNGDQYTFNIPRKQGGTLECCSVGADGFDRNAWQHFLVMSNELSTPKILICPADTSKSAAANFSTLTASNLSYQLHSGKQYNDNNPTAVLAHCPIHNVDLMCDGRVIQRK